MKSQTVAFFFLLRDLSGSLLLELDFIRRETSWVSHELVFCFLRLRRSFEKSSPSRVTKDPEYG